MEEKTRNIYQRMLAVINELGVVAKNLKVGNGYNNYQAVSERDILDAVKPLEVKYGILSFPVSREQEPIVELLQGDKQRVAIRITTVYRFVNVDNPEDFIDITSYGDGIDSLDKAPGKAMTYADKYALMKAYKISTGDDPDQYPSEETPAAKPTPARASEEQIKELHALMKPERFKNMLTHCGLSSAEELSFAQAADFIKKLKKQAK